VRALTPEVAPLISIPLDHETAASAVRNLNNQDVGGRPLRIDLADSDPFLEGKTTVRGELVDGGFNGPSESKRYLGDRSDSSSESISADVLGDLPSGRPLPPGVSPLDAISQKLGTMDPGQLTEVLAQMKVCFSCKWRS
jgi:cleavage stimulation factor subunit 2